jgi:hypothetical protein
MPDYKSYKPGGPVMKAFHESAAFYRACAGPIGSGKTTGGLAIDPVFGALMQQPNSEGVRTFRWGVLRDTYRNLYATTMRTWNEWWPRDVGRFVGSDDRPASHQLALDTDAGRLEIEAEFRALGANSVEATCRGWELNGAGVDEADLVPQEAPTFLGGRVMRAGDVNLRQTRGVSMFFNKPDIDHWLYSWCEEGGLEGLRFFDQPPGLLPGLPFRPNPAAENIAHLDPNYYVQAATGQPEWYVTRMIRNMWGASVAGERIYPEYQDALHLAPSEMQPQAGQSLILGLDGGGTPAAVIVGRDMLGRRIVYAEVVILDPYDPRQQTLMTGVGPTRFAEAIRETLQTRFRSCRIEIGYGDPAAFYGADREMGEFSFMETIGQRLGVGVTPADSNEVSMRHEAVRGLLRELGPDSKPNLIVNPSCRWLRRGFVADYKWEQRDPKRPGAELRAQKSKTSHVHDALQYACLGDRGRAAVTAGQRYDRSAGKGLPGQIGVPAPPAQAMPWDRRPGQAVVAGTHYKVDLNLWK